MQGLPRRSAVKPWHLRVMGVLTGFMVTAVIAATVYYGIGWIKPAFGDYAGVVIAVLLSITYLYLLLLLFRI